MNSRPYNARFRVRGIAVVSVLFVCLFILPLAAQEIRGTVLNQTRGSEPSAGDEAILLRTDQSMQELARRKTDARGAFKFRVPRPEGRYLVRVLHQGVNYDQSAEAANELSVQVCDTAEQVRGLSGSIELLRAATNGNLLHVSDMYEIKNESRPPVTQAGQRTFEAYLPEEARIDSVLAAGPGEVVAIISAAAVPSEPGHFTVSFPLRPGATKIAFNYDLPYRGHAAFQPRLTYPVQQLAIMIPPTMRFSSNTSAFQLLATANSRYQTHAATQLRAGAGPEFELSGTGALPRPENQEKPLTRPGVDHPGQLSVRRGPSLPNGQVWPPSLSTAKSHLGQVQLGQVQRSSEPIALGLLTAILLVICVFLISRRHTT